MTVDDAAAILDISEGSVKDLIRDGELEGGYKPRIGRPVTIFASRFRLMQPVQFKRLRPGEWWVEGKSVRARKREIDRRGTVR